MSKSITPQNSNNRLEKEVASSLYIWARGTSTQKWLNDYINNNDLLITDEQSFSLFLWTALYGLVLITKEACKYIKDDQLLHFLLKINYFYSRDMILTESTTLKSKTNSSYIDKAATENSQGMAIMINKNIKKWVGSKPASYFFVEALTFGNLTNQIDSDLVKDFIKYKVQDFDNLKIDKIIDKLATSIYKN